MIDIETFLLSAPWWPVGAWVALYAADYYLTIWGARLYSKGAKDHVVFEASYELTPQFQKDIDLLRIFSPRFFGYVALSVAIVFGLWHIANRWPVCRAIFLLAYGGLVFRQLAILVRHARNIALFHRLKEHRGVEGCIRYSQWLTLEMSFVELVFMGLFLLAAAVVAAKVSLYGGAIALLGAGLKNRKMSRKKLSEIEGTKDGQQANPPYSDPATRSTQG